MGAVSELATAEKQGLRDLRNRDIGTRVLRAAGLGVYSLSLEQDFPAFTYPPIRTLMQGVPLPPFFLVNS